MNTTMIWRIVWKDYRTYRSLWAALFILALVTQVLVVIVGVWQGDLSMAEPVLLVLTVGSPVIFSLAVSSVSFSQEHEDGTYDYLRSLPVGPIELLAARALHVIVGMATLLAALLISNAGWRPLLGPSEVYRSMVPIFAFRFVNLAVLSIVCGTFFSLLTKRPLRSALLTATIVCSTVLIEGLNVLSIDWILSPVLIVVFCGANVALVRNWLSDRDSRPGHVSTAALSSSNKGWFRRASGRMVWLHLRRMGLAYLAMMIVCVGLVIYAAPEYPGSPDQIGAISWLLLLAGLLGVSVFYVDHRDHGFRFHAEQGTSPGFVWAVRHGVGAVVLAVILACHLGIVRAFSNPTTHPDIAVLGCLPILAYLGGQLCMLLSRSPIVAGFLSVLATACFGFLGVFGWILQIPVHIALAPVALGWLLASLLRMPGWILERCDARSLSGPMAMAGLGVVLTVASVAVFRTQEIPSVADVPLTMSAPQATADQQAAAKSVLLAAGNLPKSPPRADRDLRVDHIGDLKFDGSDPSPWGMIQPDPAESEWLSAGELNLAHVRDGFERADRLVAVRAYDDTRFVYRQELNVLISLMVADARQLQTDGQLEEAWLQYRRGLELAMQLRATGAMFGWVSADIAESLIYSNLVWWAASEGQTRARVERAAESIAGLSAAHPTCSAGYNQQLEIDHAVIRGAPDTLPLIGISSDEILRVSLVYALMPWERTRSIRATKWFASENLKLARRFDELVQYNRGVDHELIRSMDVAIVDAPVMRSLISGQIAHHASFFSARDAQARNRRRAAVWQLSLIGWKHEHGTYPDSLELIREATDLDLRDDIYTGRPFVYVPKGKQCRLAVSRHEPLASYVVPYPQDHPFLWSPGINLELIPNSDPARAESYRLGKRSSTSHSTDELSAEERIWSWGTMYGLP